MCWEASLLMTDRTDRHGSASKRGFPSTHVDHAGYTLQTRPCKPAPNSAIGLLIAFTAILLIPVLVTGIRAIRWKAWQQTRWVITTLIMLTTGVLFTLFVFLTPAFLYQPCWA